MIFYFLLILNCRLTTEKPLLICTEAVSKGCVCDLNSTKILLENGHLKCEPCIDCAVGFGRNYSCYSVKVLKKEDIICRKCKDNEFTFHGECKVCQRPCGLNEYEYKNCSNGSDRECRCKKSYYQDDSSGQCTQRCSQCLTNRPEEKVNPGQCLSMPESMRCRERAIMPTKSLITSITTSQVNEVNTTLPIFTVNTTNVRKPSVTNGTVNHESDNGMKLLWCLVLIIPVLIIVVLWCKKRRAETFSIELQNMIPKMKNFEGIIFYDFVTDVVISKLAPVLDNHPLASDFRKKIALAVCPTEANDFLNLMQNSGHLLFHIKTKKPDYPMTEFIEVLQRHKRRDVVKKVLSIKEMEDRRKGAQD